MRSLAWGTKKELVVVRWLISQRPLRGQRGSQPTAAQLGAAAWHTLRLLSPAPARRGASSGVSGSMRVVGDKLYVLRGYQWGNINVA